METPRHGSGHLRSESFPHAPDLPDTVLHLRRDHDCRARRGIHGPRPRVDGDGRHRRRLDHRRARRARAQAGPGGRHLSRRARQPGRRPAPRRHPPSRQRLHSQPAPRASRRRHHGRADVRLPLPLPQTGPRHRAARHLLRRPLRSHGCRQGARVWIRAHGLRHDGILHRGRRGHAARRVPWGDPSDLPAEHVLRRRRDRRVFPTRCSPAWATPTSSRWSPASPSPSPFASSPYTTTSRARPTRTSPARRTKSRAVLLPCAAPRASSGGGGASRPISPGGSARRSAAHGGGAIAGAEHARCGAVRRSEARPTDPAIYGRMQGKRYAMRTPTARSRAESSVSRLRFTISSSGKCISSSILSAWGKRPTRPAR